MSNCHSQILHTGCKPNFLDLQTFFTEFRRSLWWYQYRARNSETFFLKPRSLKLIRNILGSIPNVPNAMLREKIRVKLNNVNFFFTKLHLIESVDVTWNSQTYWENFTRPHSDNPLFWHMSSLRICWWSHHLPLQLGASAFKKIKSWKPELFQLKFWILKVRPNITVYSGIAKQHKANLPLYYSKVLIHEITFKT